MDTTFVQGPVPENGSTTSEVYKTANSSLEAPPEDADDEVTQTAEQIQQAVDKAANLTYSPQPNTATITHGPLATDLTRTHPRPPNNGPASRLIDSRMEEARRQRTRQQTQTIEPEVITAAKDVFDAARQTSNSTELSDVESRILALLQAREQEWNKRIHEAERSHSTAAVATATDVLCYNQLLHEMGCMLDELTGGDYVHVSRLRDPMSSIGPIGTDSKKLAEEKDILRRELDELHEDYNRVYDANARLRKQLARKDEEVNELDERCKLIHNERLKLKEKYERLRDQAQKELTRASVEYENLKKRQEEDTVGLRLKVKTLQMNNDAMNNELSIKKKEVVDLRHIIDELMSNVDVQSEADPNESAL